MKSSVFDCQENRLLHKVHEQRLILTASMCPAGVWPTPDRSASAMSHHRDSLIPHSECAIRQIFRGGQYHRFISFRYMESSFRLSQIELPWFRVAAIGGCTRVTVWALFMLVKIAGGQSELTKAQLVAILENLTDFLASKILWRRQYILRW